MSDTKYLPARHHAQGIAEHVAIDFWTQGRDEYSQYHMERAHDYFEQLAAVLGYTVERVKVYECEECMKFFREEDLADDPTHTLCNVCFRQRCERAEEPEPPTFDEALGFKCDRDAELQAAKMSDDIAANSLRIEKVEVLAERNRDAISKQAVQLGRARMMK